MQDKLISLIMVNYNGVNYIGKKDLIQAINSFLKTDYPNFEFIFVDNGSQDDSIKIVRKNFSYILDYWTIDWNYDGDVFRSNWQAIKERKSSEPVPIVAETSLKKGKKYSIAVRVVDIFGNDAFGIKEINLK